LFPYVYSFQLGNQTIALATYSLLSILGVVLAGAIYFRLVPDARERPVAHLLMLGTVVVSAAVGSRVTQILLDLRLARRLDLSLWQLIEQSGSNIIGGLVVAGLVLLVFIRRDPHRIMTRQNIDALAVAFPFGHMMGRLGCLAGGCCFGIVCEHPNPLTVTYPDNWIVAELSSVPVTHGPRIAAPLIAAIFLFFIGLALLITYQKTRTRGQIAPLYLLLYGPFRFFHDFIRGDSVLKGVWGPFTTGQWFGMFAVAVGLALLIAYLAAMNAGKCSPPFLPLNGKPPRAADAFEEEPWPASP
jgi:phosphatidylglycerol:prolipoprotein diacylglycerol transferase